jgi:hypothetical protein
MKDFIVGGVVALAGILIVAEYMKEAPERQRIQGQAPSGGDYGGETGGGVTNRRTTNPNPTCLLLLESRLTDRKDAVVGEVMNDCGKVINTAFVEFNVFNAAGVQIESSIDSAENLAPKVKWAFRASVTNRQADHVILSKVSAF